MKQRLLLLSFCLVLFSTYSSAQTPGAYAIGVKQKFNSDGSCGSNPVFENAKVKLCKYGEPLVTRELWGITIALDSLLTVVGFDSVAISKSTLDNMQVLPYNFSYDEGSGYLMNEGDTLNFIAVVAKASDIKNDTRVTYPILCKNFKSGTKSNSASASDPCHNTVNLGGKRESYTQTTTIYIDDPIDLSTDGPTRYSISSDILTLKTNKFYKSSVGDYQLQVTMQTETEWDNYRTINDVNITPEGEINLTYEKIAGDKRQNGTKYYDWMGKGLKFRVVKKLINGQYTYGKIVSDVVFFPDGIQYTIDHFRRTACSKEKEVEVYIKLTDPSDSITLNGNGNVMWKARVGLNPDDLWQKYYYECSFSRDGDKYKVVMEPSEGDNLLKDITVHDMLYCELMLQEVDIEANHCIQTFVIPPKPSYVTMEQVHGNFTVGTDTFDLLVAHEPYAVIKAIDDYIYADERMPYYIKGEDGTPLDTIEVLSNNLNLDDIDEEKLDSAFVAEVKKDDGEWAAYLRANYNEWYDKVKNGEVYDGGIDEISYGHIASTPSLSKLLVANSSQTIIYAGDLDSDGYSSNEIKLSLSYRSSDLKPNPSIASTQGILYSIDEDEPDVNYYKIESGNLIRYMNTISSDEPQNVKDTEFVTVDNSEEYYVVGENELRFYVKKDDSYGYLSLYGNYMSKIETADNALFSGIGGVIVYTKEDINGLFYIKELHDADGTKISNLSVSSINYIDEDETYCIYKVGDTYYKRDFYIESVEDLLADTTDTSSWHSDLKLLFDDFKEAFRKRWLMQNYGYKLYGLDINTPYQLHIVDNDGCPTEDKKVDVEVEIKMPDQPEISYSYPTPPSTRCAKDGAITIHYDSNGIDDYCLNGDISKVLSIGSSIRVEELAIQDTVRFYGYKENNGLIGKLLLELPIDFSDPADLIIETQARTDKYSPNGSVKVSLGNTSSDKKVFQLMDESNSNLIFVSDSTTSSEHTFYGLPRGTYTTNVSFKGCPNGNLAKSDIQVSSNVFSLDVTTIPSDLLGTNGSFTVSIDNGSYSDVVWGGTAGSLVAAGSSESTYTAPGGSYSLIGALKIGQDDDGQDVYVRDTVNFVVEAPSFNGVANIDYYKSEGNLLANYELYLLNTLRLYGQTLTLNKKYENSNEYYTYSTSSGSIYKEALPEGSYSVWLDNDFSSIEIFDFVIEVDSLSSTANVTAPACSNGNASITIEEVSGGFSNGTIEYGTDGVSFNSNTEYNGIDDNEFVYYVRSSESTTEDSGTNTIDVNKTLVKQFSILIEKPDTVSASLIDDDVTCNGLNNGSLSLDNLIGGNSETTYLFQVDEMGWLNAETDVQSNLAPGIYTVYLKDGENECEAVSLGEFEIKEPDSLAVENITIIQPTCELENGVISVEVQGGNNAYKYNWQYEGADYFNSGDDFLTDSVTQLGDTLHYGQYKLNVIDPYGCTLDTTLVLDEYTNPFVVSDSVSIIDAFCYGDSNGAIRIGEIAGSRDLQRLVIISGEERLDSVTAIPNRFENLSSGAYRIEVVDENQCVSNQDFQFTINQPESPLLVDVDTIRPVLYKGSSSAYIGATVSGGNVGTKNLVLKNSTDTELGSLEVLNNIRYDFESLSQGSYWLEATDSKGCAFTSEELSVEEPTEELSFNVLTLENAQCKARTGAFTVEGTGGWGNYTYKKAEDYNYLSNNEFSGLYAGKYLVSVQDKLGAVYTDTVEISEPQDYLELHIQDTQLPTCESNGSVELLATGGTAPYQLMYEDDTNLVDMGDDYLHTYTGLSADTYTLKTVDFNGCVFNINTTLGDELLLRDLELKPKYPSAANVDDGALTATFLGGEEPFVYTWSKVGGNAINNNKAELNNISSGFYQLEVQDNTGCSVSAQTYLPGAYDIALSLVEKGDETAYQANNGYAIFDFNQSDFQSVSVLLADGSVVEYTISDVNTLFNADGQLYLNGLSGGQYSMYVLDTYGEVYFANFEIEEYIEFVFGKVTVTPALKRNVASGSALVSVKGGLPEYTFTWINIDKNTEEPATTQGATSLLENVNAGTYLLTVKDQYDNEISTEVEILEPETDLAISIVEYRNESCKTYEDAFVKLAAEGGWGDYQFKHVDDEFYVNAVQWNNLDVRTHKFYLTDMYGVTDSVTIDITEPEYLHSSVSLIDSVTCNGLADGVVEFNVSGGTEPYKYAFSTRPDEWVTETTSTGLAEGSYVYFFTDNNTCVGQDTLEVYVPQPDVLDFDVTDVTHTTCNTDNGTITVAMQGGSVPYSYEWRDASDQIISTDSVVNDLVQNAYYSVDVYDYHSCHQFFEQVINPSTVPVVNTIETTPVLCYGDSNGTAVITDVTAASPYAPYNFTWSNGQQGETSDGWESDMHYVTVTDTNYCESTTYFDIETPDSLRLSVSSFKDAHCYGYDDGYIEVNPIGGVGGYEFLWSNGDTGALADTLSQGEYTVQLTDANNCIYNQTFTISEPEEALIDIGDDIKMCPGNTITIDGQDYSTYRWSIPSGEVVSNERYFSTSEEQDYYLRVTNAIGCFAYDTISISIGNDALQADFLMTSQAYLGDTLNIYELSNLPLDSMVWAYDPVSFLALEGDSDPDYILYLETMQQGMFNVGLEAYSGGCVSKAIKQVEVFAAEEESDESSNLGYQEPLIQSLKVAPNPSDGNFDVLIGLREEADVNVDIYSVNMGAKVDEQERNGSDDYTIVYRLTNLNTGMYVVVVTAENERKQVKIIIE